MTTLDLGCGTAKVKGAIGVDKIPLVGVDVIADIAEYPYVFADNSFNAIYLNDVIEHIPNTIRTMEEIHRIACPDAKIFIKVVNWNHRYAAMDPTHVKLFTENSFDFFGKRKGRSYYTHARFDIVRVDHIYDGLARRYLRSKRLMRALSSYLCNILQGLNFELRAVKNEGIAPKRSEDESTLFSLLRCPHCIAREPSKSGVDQGRLELVQDCWLVCQEKGCGRKYAVYDGLPVMLLRKAEQWIQVPVQDLPMPPGEIERIYE